MRTFYEAGFHNAEYIDGRSEGSIKEYCSYCYKCSLNECYWISGNKFLYNTNQMHQFPKFTPA
jgi:hypothetical protein